MSLIQQPVSVHVHPAMSGGVDLYHWAREGVCLIQQPASVHVHPAMSSGVDLYYWAMEVM